MPWVYSSWIGIYIHFKSFIINFIKFPQTTASLSVYSLNFIKLPWKTLVSENSMNGCFLAYLWNFIKFLWMAVF